MPLTFTHPLAVVPFHRLCPRWLNFSGLILGSMSPDFGYYLCQFDLAHFAHSFIGTVCLCLPSGLLVWSLFHRLRRPLCFILPQPHRGALMPLALAGSTWNFRTCLSLAVSILLGAWTHVVWDSFTHPGAWVVQRVAWLREPLLHVGATELPACYLLQQLSTFVGGATLVMLYGRWLRGRHATYSPESDSASVSDWARYRLLAALAGVALVVAIPMAMKLAGQHQGYMALRVFGFRTGVYAAALFAPLLAIGSVLFYSLNRPANQ